MRINKMGNIKTWFIFGFEKWGGLNPAYAYNDDNKYMKPLFFGLWARCKKPKVI